MHRILPDEGLTFDDVLLIPEYSAVVPSMVDLSTKLGSIQLKIPIISAAMDSITESKMAIAISLMGGIGIIHRNLSIEEQVDQVIRVKKHDAENVVLNPEFVNPNTPVREIVTMTRKNGFGTYPVVDGDGKLVGLVTRLAVQCRDDTKQRTAADLMEKNVVTVTRCEAVLPVIQGGGREDDLLISSTIDMTRGQIKRLMVENRVKEICVTDRQGRLDGLITSRDLTQNSAASTACRNSRGELCVGAAVGCGPDTMDRVQQLFVAGVDLLVVDSSHGHCKAVLDTIRNIRELYPLKNIVGGNVCTVEGARALVEAGANIVKVGIGPGSICTTRIVTGCGYPQFSAILEVATEMNRIGVSVIADGGIRSSGDIAKALAAGAAAVMLGGMLAGTSETPGDMELFQGRAYKTYRGMGCESAMAAGSADRYFQDKAVPEKFVPEGVEGRVAFKGTTEEVVLVNCGGVRSAMGLVGCKTIFELQRQPKFVRVTCNGNLESHPHNIKITKEPKNYSGCF